MQNNIYNDSFDKFEEYYPVIATKVVDWYPSGRNTIVVILTDGSKMEYHNVLNSIRNIPNIVDEDEFTEESYQRDFSYNLMNKMVDAGFDQSLLSEKTGISQVSISKYLNRKALPSIYNCEKIARALGCSIEELTRQIY